MIEEAFAFGDSAIHKLDPRVRIACAVCYSVLVALLTSLPSMAFSLLISLSLCLIAQLRAGAVMGRVLVLNMVMALFWLVVPFTFSGEAVLQLGPLAATREGFDYATAITIKSNAIFLCLIALIATMPAATVGYAMQGLGFPVKVVTILLLSYRYIFVIEQEYMRLVRAIKARGFDAGNNLHTYKTYAYLVGMLFVRSWDRAERVHRAMICRGFDGRFYCLRQYRLSGGDLLFSAALGLALAAVGSLEWIRWGL